MKSTKNVLWLLVFNIYFFQGCATLQDVSKTSVANRTVEYCLKGKGDTTIVFETGMGPDIDTWVPIFDSLSHHTRVFAYNRPGYGSSNIKNPPRHIEDVAKQLNENLEKIGVPPPYIIVGHSAGGLYANMYARQYPENVAGVVMIDASHPGQFEYFRKDKPLFYQITLLSAKKSNRNYEVDLVKHSLSDFISAPVFPEIPLTVLTAGKKSSPLETKKMRQKWIDFQNELVSYTSDSQHIIVNGSGHFIHKDDPDKVIYEILKLINI